MLVRSQFLVDAVGYNKVQGKPFYGFRIGSQDRGDV